MTGSSVTDQSLSAVSTVPPVRIPVTVVIAARNEAAGIAQCIGSVGWAAEIIVAENGSSDATTSVASGAGAIVMHDTSGTIGAQRNSAIARASHEWILVIDADERGSLALRDAVGEVIAQSIGGGGYGAYRIPRRNFFLGREIRHGGWDRDRPVRLFRATLRYNDSKVHEHVVAPGVVGVLRTPLLHYPYMSLDQYFEKFDRYSRWWAEQQYQRGRRTSVTELFLKPPARFLKMYIVQLGILDGAHGLILAGLAAASVFAKYIRLWEQQRKGACLS
jgi:glycosyltransferase involved in cell wall biosynthesis